VVKFYKVGGCVRDKLLGRKCNDIDYSVEAPSFDAMRDEIIGRGGEIFLETPQYLTIRAKVPGMGACDFVLCRKDGQYFDGRHPESVEPGSIYDDLARRDFTMNAIAEDEDGNLIDPHNGQRDIEECMIRCVGIAKERFLEDALRLLRAVRFSSTLNFFIHSDIDACLHDVVCVFRLVDISIERIREELLKAFRADTLSTLYLLERYSMIKKIVFGKSLWLMPTLKQ
jgi:tRNA nucleotidyltransferase (CCA-adding enzyme)